MIGRLNVPLTYDTIVLRYAPLYFPEYLRLATVWTPTFVWLHCILTLCV